MAVLFSLQEIESNRVDMCFCVSDFFVVVVGTNVDV